MHKFIIKLRYFWKLLNDNDIDDYFVPNLKNASAEELRIKYERMRMHLRAINGIAEAARKCAEVKIAEANEARGLLEILQYSNDHGWCFCEFYAPNSTLSRHSEKCEKGKEYARRIDAKHEIKERSHS